MATKVFAGVSVEVNGEGYLTDSSKWTPEVAKAMAAEDSLEITDAHLKVLQFIRERVSKGENLTIRSIGKSGLTDIKGFYQLFPGAPLRNATKYAGVGKPTSCV